MVYYSRLYIGTGRIGVFVCVINISRIFTHVQTFIISAGKGLIKKVTEQIVYLAFSEELIAHCNCAIKYSHMTVFEECHWL